LRNAALVLASNLRTEPDPAASDSIGRLDGMLRFFTAHQSLREVS